jgi:hypothetical protein
MSSAVPVLVSFISLHNCADPATALFRSLFTPPKRESFKPARLRAPSNSLNYRASNIRTKTAVVRLRRRRGPERDQKRPKMGLSASPRGSDRWPRSLALCGVPAGCERRKKNVPNGQTGGGRGAVVEPSPPHFQWVTNYTKRGGCCLENRRPALTGQVYARRCVAVSIASAISAASLRNSSLRFRSAGGSRMMV